MQATRVYNLLEGWNYFLEEVEKSATMKRLNLMKAAVLYYIMKYTRKGGKGKIIRKKCAKKREIKKGSINSLQDAVLSSKTSSLPRQKGLREFSS